ncbi:hypothetical protein Bca4012_026830 [Brassica carinata]
MLTLRLQSGDSVCASLYDSVALAFLSKFDSYGKKPKLVLATSGNPKIVGACQVMEQSTRRLHQRLFMRRRLNH